MPTKPTISAATIVVLTVLADMLFTAPRPALAYRLTGDQFPLEHVPITLDLSNLREDWREDIRFAAAQWNGVGNKFWFNISDTAPSTPDGSIVVFDTSEDLCDGAAGCYGWEEGHVGDRAGIALYEPRLDIPLFEHGAVREVVVHELGHAIGLGHNTVTDCIGLRFRSVMGCNLSPIIGADPSYQTPFEDDIDGDNALWGPATPYLRAISPTLHEPANGATAATIRPSFSWQLFHTSGEQYLEAFFQISPHSDMTEPFSPQFHHVGNSESYTLPFDLVPGETYYWRVKANNAHGPSDWSPVWTLHVDSSVPPGGEPPDTPPGPVDPTPPEITVSIAPPPNARGWNNAPTTVYWSVRDLTSGIASRTGCDAATVPEETAAQTLTCTATNGVGLVATESVTIRIDMTPPVTGMTHDPPAPNGKRGWYISDLTFTLDPQDPLLTSGEAGSGVQYTKYQVNGGPWLDYAVPFVVSTESKDNVVRWYSVDNADNPEAPQEFHFKLDKTPPLMQITQGVLDGIAWDQAHLEKGVLTNTDTLALSGNTTDNLCLWEARVLHDAVLWASWPGNELTSLGYSTDVPLHVGINDVDAESEDCAGWGHTVATQEVYVIPGPYTPRTYKRGTGSDELVYDPRLTGWWYTGIRPNKYTQAEFQTLLDYVNVASDAFGPGNIYGDVTLDNYRSILVPRSKPLTMEALQKAQLLVSWLNLVSGRVAVLTPVNLRFVPMWTQILDNTPGPQTFALNVPMEVEEVNHKSTATALDHNISRMMLLFFNARIIIP